MVPTGVGSLVVLIGWQLRPKGLKRHANRSRSRPVGLRSIAVAATLSLISPVLGLAAMTTTVVWRSWSRVHRLKRDAHRVAIDFPDALDLLVLCIRAGYLPAQAIGEVTPHLPVSLRPSFSAVAASMHDGARFADSLGLLAATVGPIAQPLIDSLASADRYGLPLAPVLERLSFEARQQRRRDTDASARELPVRLAVPLVLCTLPSFVLLAIVPLLLGALSSLRA
jgi:Flp pilus assembly protein TadB